MPKQQTRSRANDAQFTLSYKTLGAVVSLVVLIGGLWSAIGKVATKDDVKELATTYGTTYQAIESRVRNLEIQFATFFGKSNTSPASLKATPSEDDTNPEFSLVQYGGQMPDYSGPSQNAPRAYQPPTRRVVVTMLFIKEHELQPTRGGVYGLLGEDGQFYSLDDVLSILVKEHDEPNRFNKMKR